MSVVVRCYPWTSVAFMCRHYRERNGVLNHWQLDCSGSLKWRPNGHDGVSNHQPHDCLLNRLSRRRSKKTSKLRVTGLCAGIHPAQRASNAENVSIWWRHHVETSVCLSWHASDLFCNNKQHSKCHWLIDWYNEYTNMKHIKYVVSKFNFDDNGDRMSEFFQS